MRTSIAVLVLVLSGLSARAQTTATSSSGGGLALTATTLSPTSSSATTTSIDRAAPTANSTTEGANAQDLFLWPPQGGLRQCERATFAFVKPAVALTCGIYVTGSSTYLEQVILAPQTYNTLVAGTFSWLVDMPVGLSLNVQIFVSVNGRTQQYTLPSLVVQEGTDNSCFARNIGQNTQSIISYASSLNGSYVYTAPASSSTSARSSGRGGGLSRGAIAGVVIGVVLGVALVLLIALWFLVRRQKLRNGSNVPSSQFQPPPPATTTFAQNYAQSVMSNNHHHHNSRIPYQQSAPPGTLAEPVTKRVGEGTEGLADPNSFVSRSNSGKAL
ncbi:hypothetical protein JCM3766R1_003074 [Sporobolomyces carnicolor]